MSVLVTKPVDDYARAMVNRFVHDFQKETGMEITVYIKKRNLFEQSKRKEKGFQKIPITLKKLAKIVDQYLEPGLIVSSITERSNEPEVCSLLKIFFVIGTELGYKQEQMAKVVGRNRTVIPHHMADFRNLMATDPDFIDLYHTIDKHVNQIINESILSTDPQKQSDTQPGVFDAQFER
jgi:hypothetical protein